MTFWGFKHWRILLCDKRQTFDMTSNCRVSTSFTLRSQGPLSSYLERKQTTNTKERSGSEVRGRVAWNLRPPYLCLSEKSIQSSINLGQTLFPQERRNLIFGEVVYIPEWMLKIFSFDHMTGEIIVIIAPAGFWPLGQNPAGAIITRGGTLGVPACIHTRTKNICWKSKKCVCNGGKILDLTKLGAHGGLG